MNVILSFGQYLKLNCLDTESFHIKLRKKITKLHEIFSISLDQIQTVFDQQRENRGQPVYAGQTFNPAPKTGGISGPSGPNFRVGRASAPSFKPSQYSAPKGPPPPAVNAGEVLNPNSRSYQGAPQQAPVAAASYQPQSQSNTYNPASAATYQPQQRSPASSTSSIGSGGYQPQSPSKPSPAVFDPAANRSPKPFTPAGSSQPVQNRSPKPFSPAGSGQPAAAPASSPGFRPQSFNPASPAAPSQPQQQAPAAPAPARPQQQMGGNPPPQTAGTEGDLYCSACQQPLV